MGGVLFGVGKVGLQSVSRNERWSLLTSWLADYSGGRTSSSAVLPAKTAANEDVRTPALRATGKNREVNSGIIP